MKFKDSLQKALQTQIECLALLLLADIATRPTIVCTCDHVHPQEGLQLIARPHQHDCSGCATASLAWIASMPVLVWEGNVGFTRCSACASLARHGPKKSALI
jgi:hypothetical protein